MKKKSAKKDGGMFESLTRLFHRRSESPVVAKLYSHAIGRPLLVNPILGDSMLRGFLRGAAFDGKGDADIAATLHPVALQPGAAVELPGAATAKAGVIAVLNITGPLVSRPEPGECGPGPMSYEGIRAAFDDAMDDGNVAAIVMRMDSAGGLVSGCFDLTDHIFSRRGAKPIVAQIDDMAYSACYAIASACDRIQVTRTSGVGSVGVFTAHVDLSGAYEQAGVKVTYIYSGSHKIDGNSTEPLPESVRNAWQIEIDATRDLFVQSVAKYRGMDASAVADTEADTYNGAAAVAIGFADSVGTLSELLAELAAPAPAPETPLQPTTTEDDEDEDAMDPNAQATPAAESPEQKTAREAAEATAAAAADATAKTHAANAAKVALSEAVTASKLPSAAQIAVLKAGPREGVSAADQVAQAQSIVDACAAAKLPDEAASYISRGVSIDTARTELAAASATTNDRVDTTHRPPSSGDIYAKGVAKLTAEHNRKTGKK